MAPSTSRTSPKGRQRDKPSRGHSQIHDIAVLSENPLSLLSLPVMLKNKHCKAIVDTGSAFLLIQESLWKRLERYLAVESWADFCLSQWSCPSSFSKSHMGMLTEWVYLPTEIVYHEGSGFDISTYSGP